MKTEVIAQAKVVLAILGRLEFAEEMKRAKTPGEVAEILFQAMGGELPDASKSAERFYLHGWWGSFLWSEEESALLLIQGEEDAWRWN
jgi:hypothetical protein